MASEIQEYLKQVRAAGATPTFTNIGGENPMLAPGPGRPMGGTQVPGAYMIKEAGGQPTMDASGAITPAPAPAIPAQGQDVAESQVGQQDPWVMAQQSTKGLMKDIWTETFGDKPFNSELDKDEMALYDKNVKSMRNAEVDRFKHQQEQIGKERDRTAREKAALPAEELNIKQRADFLIGFEEEHAKIVNDPLNPMRKQLQGITASQYAADRLKKLEANLGAPGAIPEEGEMAGAEAAAPVEPAQPGAIPGRGPAPGAGAGVPPPVPSAPMDLRKEIQNLAATYGRTPEGMQRAREELRRRYPQLQLK